MRQNPQVILFGEMRNTEEIEMALTLAETGHLVFSTLHTRSAYQTISRIIDSFEAGQQNQIRLQLADALMAVFSQRLLKTQD
jgi:twitching motility protein PilT